MSSYLQGSQWLRQGTVLVTKSVEPGSTNQPGLDLSGFRLRFEIKRSDDVPLSTAVVRIFNLADATVKSIAKDYSGLTIQAGYQNTATGVIFNGQIVQTKRGKERNVDSYLDVLAVENHLPYNFALANQTFAPGTSQEQVWNYLNGTLTPYGGSQTAATPPVGGIVSPRGKVLFGLSLDYMTDTALSNGYSLSIQNGVVTPVPLTGYLPGEAVVLNSKTGLIGQPEATQQGVEVTCLINPKIRVGTRIQINNADINQTLSNLNGPSPANPTNPFSGFFASTAVDGFYRVLVVEYEGDTRGQPWYQKLVCLILDPSSPANQAAKLYPN